MSALGKLVASVVLDTAEFTGGTDKAQYAAANAAAKIDRTFKSLENSVKGTLAGMAAAFAAGVGIAALKAQFDQYTEGAAKLQDLALKAGTTVQFLSGISPVAKLAGTSLEDVANAAGKLAKGLINQDLETAGAGKALAFLGIKAKDATGAIKDTGTLMDEIALKLNDYADGTVKAAMVQDLFGKSGREMLPFLKDLAEYGVRNAKVTEQQAALAKEYEKDIIRLGIAKNALGKIISAEVLPVADAVIKTFLKMQTQTGGVRDQVQALADDGSIKRWAVQVVEWIGFIINAGDGVKRVFSVIGEEIGYQMARVGTALGSIGSAIISFIEGDYKKAWAEIERGSKRGDLLAISHAQSMQDILDKPLAGDSFVKTFHEQLDIIETKLATNQKSTKKSADGYKEFAKGAREASDAVDSLGESLGKDITKLQTELDFMRQWGIQTKQVTVATVEFEIAQGKIGAVLKDRTKYTAEEAEAFKKWLLNLASAKDGLIQATEAEKEFLASVKRINDELAKSVQVTADLIQPEKDRIATIGMTCEQITRYNIAQLESKKVLLEAIDGTELHVKALDLQIDKLRELAGLQKNYDEITKSVGMWTELSDRAGKFFGDLVINGKGAFDRLKGELKSFAQEIIALFAKKYILQMVAGVTGSGAMGNAAASTGMNSLAGTAMNAGIDYFTGGAGIWGMGAAGSYAGATSSMIGAGAGAEAAVGFGTETIAAGGLGSFASGIGTAVMEGLAAIGPVGWIALAAIAIYAMFGGKGGGPKGGGSFNANYGAAGDMIGSIGVPGSDNGRFFTPSNADDTVRPIVEATSRTYFETLRRLGGSSPGATFGGGFDTDPQGTAENRVSFLATVGGRSVYDVHDHEIGRDQENIGPEMQLQASRALVAALRASQLPAYLSKLFDSFAVESASQEQLDNLVKQAYALKSIYDLVDKNPLEDVAASYEASQNQLETALKKNEDAIRSIASAYDGSFNSTMNLATATQQYYQAQLQLLAGIGQIKQAVDDMFGQTFRNIELAGMDNQGRYEFYQQEAQALQQQALASGDPETIRRLSERINADINAAFGLLSPEEQSAQSGAFLERGRAAQAQIDERLTQIQQDTANATQAMLQQLKDILTAGATEQARAAENQNRAADTQLAAARTPIQIIMSNDDGSHQLGVTTG